MKRALFKEKKTKFFNIHKEKDRITGFFQEEVIQSVFFPFLTPGDRLNLGLTNKMNKELVEKDPIIKLARDLQTVVAILPLERGSKVQRIGRMVIDVLALCVCVWLFTKVMDLDLTPPTPGYRYRDGSSFNPTPFLKTITPFFNIFPQSAALWFKGLAILIPIAPMADIYFNSKSLYYAKHTDELINRISDSIILAGDNNADTRLRIKRNFLSDNTEPLVSDLSRKEFDTTATSFVKSQLKEVLRLLKAGKITHQIIRGQDFFAVDNTQNSSDTRHNQPLEFESRIKPSTL